MQRTALRAAADADVSRTKIMLRIFIAVLSVVAMPVVAAEHDRPRMPITAEILSSIERIPFGKEGAPGSPEFHVIVREGLAIVPELADLLDNPTLTENRVPLTGGHYAVGDVAMAAISDIVRVPWLEFITTREDPRIATQGFGVYWNYVRESAENRSTLKAKFLKWFEENEKRLTWRPIPEILDGGIYECPEDGGKDDG